MELSAEEYQRYNRQIRMEGFGPEAQLKLKKAAVLVVGAGGLGCPALLYLATAGVGKIGIADNDLVGLSNLQRQVLYDTADIGRPKATAAAEKLLKKNPNVAVHPFETRVTAANVLDLIRPYDIVIDGTDNFETAYLLNDACVMLDKPLVYGSLHQYEGQLSTFNFQGGPTLRCLFPEPPDDAENCSIAGVLAVVAGLIGTWQASEAIKIITGTGKPLSGELLIFQALDNRLDRIRFNAVPENRQVTSLNQTVPAGAIAFPALVEQVATGSLQLIDVRESWEFEEFNLGGTNIPLFELPVRMHEIDPARDTVVVCLSGKRSAQAVALILDRFPEMNIQNLQNGLQDYRQD